jgi:hypothetical protein
MSGKTAEGKFRWGVVFLSGLEGEVVRRQMTKRWRKESRMWRCRKSRAGMTCMLRRIP